MPNHVRDSYSLPAHTHVGDIEFEFEDLALLKLRDWTPRILAEGVAHIAYDHTGAWQINDVCVVADRNTEWSRPGITRPNQARVPIPRDNQFREIIERALIEVEGSRIDECVNEALKELVS